MVQRLVLCALVVLSGPICALRAVLASPDGDAPGFSTTLSVWQSKGTATWSHDASAAQPLFGNPTSRLEYDGVDSTIVELRARADLPEGSFVELAYGAGSAYGGRLTDTDFVSAQGAEAFGTAVSGAHAYSKTVSILDGDAVHYFDAMFGSEAFRSPGGESRGGLAVRYLDWTEQYSVRGVRQTVCTAPARLCLPAGTAGFNDQEVIYNDARWRALFVGVWGRHHASRQLELSGELAFSPLTDLSSDDRHFLRADLGRNPSFRLEGQGLAATARVDVSYRFSPRLAAGLGLRYWWMEVRGEPRGFTAFPASAAPFSARLNSFESQRYGVMLSIAYALGHID